MTCLWPEVRVEMAARRAPVTQMSTAEVCRRAGGEPTVWGRAALPPFDAQTYDDFNNSRKYSCSTDGSFIPTERLHFQTPTSCLLCPFKTEALMKLPVCGGGVNPRMT